MRNAIKIKVFFMLLAWLLIFLHGVIPHMHNDHSQPGCHHLVHHVDHYDGTTTHNECDHDHEQILLNTAGENHNTSTCHYVAYMFHINHVDKIFIAETGWSSVEIVLSIQKITDYIKIDTGPQPCYSLLPQRAPPSVA